MGAHWPDGPDGLTQGVDAGVIPPPTARPERELIPRTAARQGGVLYAYLDESFAEGHFYVAGFVVNESQLAFLEYALENLMREEVAPKFAIPWKTELHGNRIMRGQDPWKCLRGRTGEGIWIYRETLKLLAPNGARTFIQGVDVNRLHQKYGSNAHSPYLVALRHALERIDKHAGANGYESVQVVADEVDDAKIYNAAVSGYKENGTPGYQPSRLTRTAAPVRFLDSETSYGLQMADMIAYIARRHLEPTGSTSHQSRRAASKLFGYVWDQVAVENSVRTKWVPPL